MEIAIVTGLFAKRYVKIQSGHRAYVDQAMQRSPALPEPPDHASRRSRCEGNHQHKSQEPHRDEFSLGDILPNVVPDEKFIEPKIRREMERPIKKRKQPQHAPVLNQPILLRELPQRRNRQRDQQKAQCPVAGCMGNHFQWVCAEIPLIRRQRQMRDRKKARGKHNQLAPSNRFHSAKLTLSCTLSGFLSPPASDSHLRKKLPLNGKFSDTNWRVPKNGQESQTTGAFSTSHSP